MATSTLPSTWPVSISCLRRKVLAPVVVSPFRTAQWIGAAPRYWGRSDPCRLTVPKRGRFHTTSGNMRNATTTPRSASHSSSSAWNSGDFSFSGWARGRLCARATCFTSEARNVRPRPAGRSGAVTTPTTLCWDWSNCSRHVAANWGVPRKRMRKDSELDCEELMVQRSLSGALVQRRVALPPRQGPQPHGSSSNHAEEIDPIRPPDDVDGLGPNQRQTVRHHHVQAH